MILHTERLILRPWDEADAESLYEYAKDDRVGPIAGWPPHTSAENSREIIRTVLSEPETYAVCLKEDNRAIGSIGLMIGKNSNLDLPENEGEIGYWIGVSFWGQGLIPEAVRELIRRAFDELHLVRLWCGYFDGNEKSKRCQEKCGFVYHHTNKDIPWKLMGDIRTEHITCLDPRIRARFAGEEKMDSIEKIIQNTTEENQSRTDWTKAWSTKYPILKTYQSEVDIPQYAGRIREMFTELQQHYGYSELDAMLVLKDILAHEYMDHLKK